VEDFSAAVRSEDYTKAAALFAAPFLVYYSDHPTLAFEQWCDGVRAGVARKASGMLESLAVRTETEGNWSASLAYSERLLELDRTNLSAHAVRLRSIAALQGHDTARRTANEVLTLFASEADGKMSVDLRELCQRFTDPSHVPIESVTNTSPRLVGRDVEFTRLSRTYEAVAMGYPTLITVSGPAGIGKSRLCEHFLKHTMIKGARCFYVDCSPAEIRVPFAALVEALRFGLRAQDVRELSTDEQTVLAPILPEIRSLGAPVDSGRQTLARRDELFLGLRNLIDRIAAGRPTVLLFDNVQWADESTAWWVHYYTYRLVDSQVAIVLAYREDDPLPDQISRLLELHRIPNRVDIPLRPLNIAQSKELVESTAAAVGLHLPSDEVQALVDVSGGVPFYLLAGLRRIAYRNAAKGTTDVVANGRRVQMASNGPLDDSDRRLLEVLATLGGNTSIYLLAQVLHASQDAIRTQVGSLADRGFVRSDQIGVSFIHDLIREQMLATVSNSLRAETHRRAARTLSQSPLTHPGVLALHLVAAGEDSEAALAAFRAAKDAVAVCAYRDAEFYFAIALNRVSSRANRLSIIGEYIQYLCGLERLREASEWRRELVDSSPGSTHPLPLQTELLLDLYDAVMNEEFSTHQVLAQIDSLSLETQFDADPDALGGLIRLILAVAHSCGRVQLTREIVQRFTDSWVAHSRRKGRPELLTCIGRMWAVCEDSDRGINFLEESIDLARRNSDQAALLTAMYSRATARLWRAEIGAALHDFETAAVLACAPGFEQYGFRIKVNHAVALMEAGRWSEAEQLLKLTIPVTDRIEDLLVQANLAIIAAETRRLEDAMDRLESLRKANAVLNVIWVDTVADTILAWGHLLDGRQEKAWQVMRLVETRLACDPEALGPDGSYTDSLVARYRGQHSWRLGYKYACEARQRYVRSNRPGFLRVSITAARILAEGDVSQAVSQLTRVIEECGVGGAVSLAEEAQGVLANLEGRAIAPS
jgi:tetratricopeptide (TPR) repeat protein